MDDTQKTIAFLRTLTLDGVLTAEEVWALAKFFNRDEFPFCIINNQAHICYWLFVFGYSF